MGRFDDESTQTDLILPEEQGTAQVALGEAEARESLAPPENPLGPPEGLEECAVEIGVAIIETNQHRRIVAMNAIAERLTGWSLDEAHGQPLDEVFRLVAPSLQPGDSFRGLDVEQLAQAMSSMGNMAPARQDLSLYVQDRTALLSRRDGSLVPLRHVVGTRAANLNLGATLDSELVSGELVVFRDLGHEQLLSLQLARYQRRDPLTGLLNRKTFEERIERALTDSRKREVRHGLGYFDLDRFRLVNMTCGHTAGDDLLQWVATRIHEVIGPTDAAARIGGDEFAVLISDRSEEAIEQIFRDFQRRLLEFRFGWGQKTFSVGASFGLVFFGAEYASAAALLGEADDACRLAKEHGRGRIQILAKDDEETQHKRRSMDWVASLQRNLAEGRLRLYAQGVYPLTPGHDEGAHFEILVRQVGDDGQLHSPVRIIQAAENIGLMDAIDRFVVRQALKTLGALPAASLRNLKLCSINLSGISLVGHGLLDFIVDELAKTNVPPSKICFEITETATLANLDEVLWLMQELKGMGCRFAIDDFGSGHASYGYVERLPVDHVKIDGQFVRDLVDNSLHRAICQSVHLIGRTLNIETVAESVENQEVADVLAGIGIDYAQGWHYGKPRPLTEICAELGE